MPKMKKELVFGFRYHLRTRVVSECTIPSLDGESFDAVLSRAEVTNLLADIKDFQTGRLLEFIEDGSPVNFSFESLTSGRGYNISITRLNDDEAEFALRKQNSVGGGKVPRWMYGIASGVLLLVVAICLTSVYVLRENMMEKKSEEARDTMQMISDQIDVAITAEFNSWYNELRVFAALIGDYETLTGNEEPINAILDSARTALPFENVGILTESGDLYFSESEMTSVFSEKVARELIVNRNTVVDLVDIDDRKVIFFGIPLHESKARRSEAISAVCGIADVTGVNELLSVKAFNNNCVVSVYMNNGFSVAISENAQPPKDESRYNFFNDMGAQKSKEEMEALEASFLDGESGLIPAQYGGQDYYVYYSPLHIGDTGDTRMKEGWHLVIYVPEFAIFSGVNQVFSGVLTVMIGCFVLLILTIGLLVFLFIRKHGNDLVLKKQMVANQMMETATVRALEASKAKTMFLSNMSHDIRTPINGIIGMTTIAQNHLDDRNTVRECLGKIEGASAHLLSLVNDVLDMSRIESKKVEIVKEVMNINMVAEDCRSIILGQTTEKGIDFRLVRKGIEHPNVLGDSLHLRQVLINILGNAAKFTPDGGTITFGVEELTSDGKHMTYAFTVRDTGCGMTEEFISHAFEAFSQEKNKTRSQYKGTGLGLTISAQLVKLMGGTISVQSKPDEGSLFRVEIPFEISAESVVNDRERDVDIGGIPLQGVRVLLVEDNDLNMELATILLSESGLIVEQATNGKEACRMFEAHTEHYYDVILMDVMMPVMDGITATKCIRASSNPNAKTVPIIAMTANAFETDIRKTREAGMNAHLSKPIYINEVLRVIRRALNRTEEEQQPPAPAQNEKN